MVDFHTHWVARGQAKTLLDSIFHFLWKYVSILLKPKKYRKEERLEEMGCLIHFNSLSKHQNQRCVVWETPSEICLSFGDFDVGFCILSHHQLDYWPQGAEASKHKTGHPLLF